MILASQTFYVIGHNQSNWHFAQGWTPEGNLHTTENDRDPVDVL